MKSRHVGRRYTLLLYKRAMDRLWLATLVLGLLLALIWWRASEGLIPALRPPRDTWVFVGALVVLAFSLFALLARYMGYVQAHRDHLRIVTPFLRLNVSYQRIRQIHPTEFHQLFPLHTRNWAERRYLYPFYGRTAVVLELYDYPIPLKILRLFLTPQMFYPQGVGLVFMVADWMAFSTEVDSLRGEWLQSQKEARVGRGMHG